MRFNGDSRFESSDTVYNNTVDRGIRPNEGQLVDNVLKFRKLWKYFTKVIYVKLCWSLKIKYCDTFQKVLKL